MGFAAFVNRKGRGKRRENKEGLKKESRKIEKGTKEEAGRAMEEMKKKKLCKFFALSLAKSIEKYQFCGIISMALIVTTFNVMLNLLMVAPAEQNASAQARLGSIELWLTWAWFHGA